MTRLDRIALMEQAFDECTAALDAYEAALPKLRALEKYLSSGQWLEDYETDEAGLIPAGMKRGVLSQDALFDLLSRDAALRKRIQEAEA
ncbi:MAG: DUF4298 domain-containing protein [Clostridia bacterium]|nr:DUF4298 domain-containing protein [Clostridia bacterium]